MKKLLLLLPLVAALLATTASCKKILDLLEFNVEDSQTLTVPATLPVGTFFALPPVAVSSTSKTTYANNKTSADYVQDVRLDRLTLTIPSPQGQTFDFLRRIEVYISSDANNTNQVLLASLNLVPTGATSIQLTPADQKLDLYLRADSYTLTTKVEVTQPLTQAVTLRADTRFKVKAKPL